jgi:hypothetical protein
VNTDTEIAALDILGKKEKKKTGDGKVLFFPSCSSGMDVGSADDGATFFMWQRKRNEATTGGHIVNVWASALDLGIRKMLCVCLCVALIDRI